MAAPELDADAPGLLYYDPNPTTAKLAIAGLHLGGYRVFLVEDEAEAEATCKRHGPSGSGIIQAIVLDAAVAPDASAQILRALIQLPGASGLPGILLVSRKNPTPIPGAEGLPSLRRPFSTPALVRIIRTSLDDQRPIGRVARGASSALTVRLGELLNAHGVHNVSEEVVDKIASALATTTVPPPDAVTLHADLASTRIESVLEMLGNDGATGMLTVTGGHASGRLHLDAGRIRLGEAWGTEEDLKLGRFLMEFGFVQEDELQALLETSDDRPIGLRMVENSLLTPEDLAMSLVTQAREVTCHLLGWSEGKLSFAPSDQLDPLAAAAKRARVELLISDALLDGLRRVEEAAIMGPHMAQLDDVYLRVDEQLVKIGRHALVREELAVLELLNGRNSVKEIARKTRAGTFNVARILYRLTKANLTRPRLEPVTV